MNSAAYQGKYFSIFLDDQGVEYIGSSDEVLVVAIDERGKAILTSEPAPAFGGKAILVLPGGMVEPGEDTASAANRELQEETGFAAGQLDVLGDVSGFSKYLTTVSMIFLARELHPSSLVGDEGYEIGIEYIDLEEVDRLLAQGRLSDARTIAGLTLARSFLQSQEKGSKEAKKLDKFEEYKLFVEDTARFTDRRLTTSNVYVGINSLLLSAVAFLAQNAGLQNLALLLTMIGILIVGSVICLFWGRHIKKYKVLVNFRIDELRKMEDHKEMAGSHRMYHAEDQLYPRDASGQAIHGKGLNFSDFEKYLPYTFNIIYALFIIGFGLAIIL